MRLRHLLQTVIACAVVLRASSAPAQVIISEFLAANATGIVDDTGTRSDWLELYNAGTSPVNLDGYYLTDDPDRPNRWQFPQGMAPLAPNSYLLVWASGQNKTNPAAPLHTSFKLAREGGYLALLAPGGHLVSGFNPYPPQSSDVSYGRDRADPNAVGFFRYPTPGSPNVN